MATNKNIVVAFDLYGTLLSTESIAKKLGEHFGKEKGTALAATWRKHQLEYTWLLNSMGQFIPFSAVTQRALRNTLADESVSLSEAQIDDMMASYDALSTFPDVGPALTALGAAQDITPVVFSNGTRSMVTNSVTKSPDLSPHSSVFKELIVVEDTKRFKPDPEVYKHLARKCGKDSTSAESMGEMWLISGNPFDVVGARAVGMKAAWVDRSGNGWANALIEGDAGKPTVIIRGLGEVIDVTRKFAGK